MTHFKTSSEHKSIYLFAIYSLGWLSSRKVNLTSNEEIDRQLAKRAARTYSGEISLPFFVGCEIKLIFIEDIHVTIFIVHKNLSCRLLLFSLKRKRRLSLRSSKRIVSRDTFSLKMVVMHTFT